MSEQRKDGLQFFGQIPDANFEVPQQLERGISHLGNMFHGLYCNYRHLSLVVPWAQPIGSEYIRRCPHAQREWGKVINVGVHNIQVKKEVLQKFKM